MLEAANEARVCRNSGGRRTQVMSKNRVPEIRARRRFPPALRRRLLIRTLTQSARRTRYTPWRRNGRHAKRGVGGARTYHRTQTRSREQGAQSLRKRVLSPLGRGGMDLILGEYGGEGTGKSASQREG